MHSGAAATCLSCGYDWGLVAYRRSKNIRYAIVIPLAFALILWLSPLGTIKL